MRLDHSARTGALKALLDLSVLAVVLKANLDHSALAVALAGHLDLPDLVDQMVPEGHQATRRLELMVHRVRKDLIILIHNCQLFRKEIMGSAPVQDLLDPDIRVTQPDPPFPLEELAVIHPSRLCLVPKLHSPAANRLRRVAQELAMLVAHRDILDRDNPLKHWVDIRISLPIPPRQSQQCHLDHHVGNQDQLAVNHLQDLIQAVQASHLVHFLQDKEAARRAHHPVRPLHLHR